MTEEEELQEKLQDATLEIKGIELLENTENPETDMMLINFQEKEEFIEDCPFGNVVLACFTTAHARLHLYETLQPLGERVLYFDTDSIIYLHHPAQFNPTIVNSLGGGQTSWEATTSPNTCPEVPRIMPTKPKVENHPAK